MTEYIKYTTKQDERLDEIAGAVYADPNNWKPIIDANPTLPVLANYDAGIILRVPIEKNLLPFVDVENLPPWKK